MADEDKPYDTDLHDDVRAAMAEVTKAEPVVEAAVEAPKEPVETKTAEERARDEQGRFAKAEKDKAAKDPEKVEEKPAAEAKPVEETKPVIEQLKPGEQPKVEPVKVSMAPGTWAPKAKAQWDRLPQVVRDEILKASDGGKDYGNLQPFVERAKQSGQTVEQALRAYTGIEDLLRRDMRGGFLHIASNSGLTQHQAGQLFMTLAQQLGVSPSGGQPMPANGQSAPQPGQPQPENGADLHQLLQPVLDPVIQRLNKFETTFQQQIEAQGRQRLQTANSIIEQFRQSPEHKYYDNVEQKIGDLLERGVVARTGDFAADLAKAYDLACRMDPDISEILFTERMTKERDTKEAREREAAEKARAASKSVTGSPSPGASSTPARKSNGQSYDGDLYEDVKSALREVSARVA